MKEQKQVQEEISRMSSKAMVKVQDDIKSLKQLLSVSASGLQRNALSIDKLKRETAQVRRPDAPYLLRWMFNVGPFLSRDVTWRGHSHRAYKAACNTEKSDDLIIYLFI